MFKGRVSKSWMTVIIVLILLFILYFYPLPYYVLIPGDAIELQPIITVEDGYDEQGTFMLTTIKRGGVNVINYAVAHFNDYMELVDREEMLGHYEDEEDYDRYQLQMMDTSQDSAILMAYKLAEKEVEVINHGVLVTQTVEGMPAREHLQIGDHILSVDDQPMDTSEEMIAYLQGKAVGDTVEIEFDRDDEVHTVQIELAAMPTPEDVETESPQAGIGIGTLTDRTIEVEPPVDIDTERIGGPSAGLMFTLEIYNQLTEDDVTKGYGIAGTGTIDSEGNVGRIGGIHQKVVAADDIEADIFFAPTDGGNDVIAQEAALDIGTDMDIVSVDTVYDALEYLENLPRDEE